MPCCAGATSAMLSMTSCDMGEQVIATLTAVDPVNQALGLVIHRVEHLDCHACKHSPSAHQRGVVQRKETQAEARLSRPRGLLAKSWRQQVSA